LTVEQQIELVNRVDQLVVIADHKAQHETTVPLAPHLGKSTHEPQRLEYLESGAQGVIDAASLRKMLTENVVPAKLDLSGARTLLRQLSEAGLPEWAPFEARLWLIEHFIEQARERVAVQLFDDLLLQVGARESRLIQERLGPEAMQDLLERLRDAHGGRSLAETWLRAMRLCLAAEDFRQAAIVLAEIPAAEPQSRQAFSELEHWITRQKQPTPWMLMTLTEARRDLAEDPEAGLDVATQAALLAPHDANVQNAYRRWSQLVEPEVMARRRLSQALYLLTREARMELLPRVFADLESASQDGVETLEWLDQLLPVIVALRGISRSKARENMLRQLTANYPERLAEVYDQLTLDLDDNEQFQLLRLLLETPGKSGSFLSSRMSALEDQLAGSTRAKVESELETSRHHRRPMRYSAGEVVPVASPPATKSSSSPWRRSLALARRKRVAGDSEGAIRDLQIALEMHPREAELNLELAEAFADQGQFKISRQIFVTVLDILGTEGNQECRLRALYGMATVIEHLDNPAEAVHCLEELLTIRHDYRDSQERLEELKQMLTAQAIHGDTAPSNIAANVILEAILELLNSRAAEQAGVAN
jgi:tetratricopeptide (TPR) repeat protein